MSEYQKKLNELKNVQDKLRELVREAVGLLPQFHRLSTDINEKIQNSPVEYTAHFSKIWFKSFLAMKDEVTVLTKGELIRPYHRVQHKEWIHSREIEAHYYNKKYKLTSCCIDGVNYEYRAMKDTYGAKGKLEAIASKNDPLAHQTDSLTKQIDACFRTIEDALLAKSIRSIHLDLLHNAEVLKSNDAQLELCITREMVDIENSTLVDLLSTTIDDPTLQATKRSNRNVKRRIHTIVDSDEEEEKRLKAVALTEIKKKEELNFGLDISIDGIKRFYASKANDVEHLEKWWKADNKKNETILAAVKSRVSVTENSEYLPSFRSNNRSSNNSRRVGTNTIPILCNTNRSNKVATAMDDTVTVLKAPAKLEEELQLLKLRIYFPSYIAERDTKFVDLGILISCFADPVTNTLLPRATLSVSSTDILWYCFNYLMKRLRSPMPVYPHFITGSKSQEKGYTYNQYFPLPCNKDDVMHVHCDESKSTRIFVGNMLKFNVYPCKKNMSVIQRMLAHLRSHNRDGAGPAIETLSHFDFRNFDLLQATSTGSIPILELFLSSVCRCDSVIVDISRSHLLARDMFLLLSRCNSVNLTACGITLLHLKEFTKISMDSTHCLPDLSGTEKYLFHCLRHINFQYNSLMAGTDVQQCDDVLSQCFLILLAQSPSLRSLDVSHCASNYDEMSSLFRSLAGALDYRYSIGLGSMTIIIKGVRQEYPMLASMLQTIAVANSESFIIDGVNTVVI